MQLPVYEISLVVIMQIQEFDTAAVTLCSRLSQYVKS